MLEEMLAEITGEFPGLSSVFVDERDKYLAYSLQLAVSSVADPHVPGGTVPQTVVGVVGIGHVAGIIKYWGSIKDEDIPPLLEIKEPSLGQKVLVKSIKYSITGLLAYGVYRYVLPSVVRETCTEAAGRAWSVIQRSV